MIVRDPCGSRRRVVKALGESNTKQQQQQQQQQLTGTKGSSYVAELFPADAKERSLMEHDTGLWDTGFRPVRTIKEGT